MGVGFPATLLLQEFGSKIEDAFGDMPFHVGSSLKEKTGWRDVDVRLMLDDETYMAMGLGDPKYPHHNAKWVALCLAFSALGKEMTGLPIDFQIQQRTLANETFPGQGQNPRSALGVVPHKMKDADEVAQELFFRTAYNDITVAVKEYHAALERREHGGVAQNRAFQKIEKIIREGQTPQKDNLHE